MQNLNSHKWSPQKDHWATMKLLRHKHTSHWSKTIYKWQLFCQFEVKTVQFLVIFYKHTRYARWEKVTSAPHSCQSSWHPHGLQSTSATSWVFPRPQASKVVPITQLVHLGSPYNGLWNNPSHNWVVPHPKKKHTKQPGAVIFSWRSFFAIFSSQISPTSKHLDERANLITR